MHSILRLYLLNTIDTRIVVKTESISLILCCGNEQSRSAMSTSSSSSERTRFTAEERRQRNIQSAKRSKLKRIQLEKNVLTEIDRLEKENVDLQNEIVELKSKQFHLQLALFEITLFENSSLFLCDES